MKYKYLPGTLHFHQLNPYIELTNSPFYLLHKNQNWNPLTPELTRRAGISAFGMGGVNAHIILEEYIAHSIAK